MARGKDEGGVAAGGGALSTDLFDKEDRKSMRRGRVDRVAASQNEDGDQQQLERDKQVVGKSEQQVADSLSHLDKKKARGIDAVTAVRVASDDRETQRRMAEEEARQERLQRLQEEAVRSGKRNAAVEMRWSELLDQNMPQELYRDIETQKNACADIIASKDALISDFSLQLKTKDEEYVKELKQQADGIEELLFRMRNEFKELHEEYESELDAIEDVFIQEREVLLHTNKMAVDALFEQRREMELTYMEKKTATQERYQQEMEDLLTQDSEEYNKLKVKLETDIQTLEQQLEEMRATYQLNTEKLEYNYRVLTERDMENSATMAHQRRKLTKLKDSLSALVQRYQETDVRDRKRNDELTEEYRRITKQYKDLQAKFRHFEVADNQTYEQVWAMHQEEVMEAIARVLKADKLIHEQHLEWNWRSPNMDALANLDATLRAQALPGQLQASDAAAMAAASSKLGEEGMDGLGEMQPEKRTVSGARVRAVLRLIAGEAGFLVDQNLEEALKALTPDEAEYAAAESSLKALGVENEEDLETLMGYFFSPEDPDVDYEEVPAKADFSALGLDPDREPEALKVLMTIIQPDDVVRAIHSFVEDRKEARLLDQARSKNLTLDEPSGRGNANKTREKVIRAREKEYWTKLSSVLSEQGHDVLGQLEVTMKRYNSMLAERSRRIEVVEGLQGENAHLKSLLRQYLGSAVNEDLIVPPSDTIMVTTATAGGA